MEWNGDVDLGYGKCQSLHQEYAVYDTTQILSEKRKWKRSSQLYYEYHYLHAVQSMFMRWLTTSYSNLSHVIRILPYNKSVCQQLP